MLFQTFAFIALYCFAGLPKTAIHKNLKIIPNLLSDDREDKIIENIDFIYFSNQASFIGNPAYFVNMQNVLQIVIAVHEYFLLSF